MFLPPRYAVVTLKLLANGSCLPEGLPQRLHIGEDDTNKLIEYLVRTGHLKNTIRFIDMDEEYDTSIAAKGVTLTDLGMEVATNLRPFVDQGGTTINQNGVGNTAVAHSHDVEVNTNIILSDSFAKARLAVEDGNMDNKVEVLEALETLEEQANSSTPDATTFQRAWDFIKKAAPVVVPILAQVVKQVWGNILGEG